MTKLSTVPAAPRNWLSWIAIFLLILVAQLPYRWVMRLGRGLGVLSMRLLKSRRRVADINLNHCFPTLSTTQRAELVRQTFAANGQGFFEAAFAWWAPARRINKLKITITGLELIRPENLTQGIILLYPHLTTLEICGRLVGVQLPLNAVYQSSSDPVFDYVIHKERSHYFKNVYNRRNLRQIIAGLRAKEVIIYLPDQDFGIENSVFAPFFGVPAATATATAKLAKMANAKVVIASGQRDSDGRGYTISFKAFPDTFPTGDEVADATFINQQIEQVISQDRSNYLWLHRRFKTRPAGEQKLY
jgi:KDO2-lipid IV(A) lauroyltransferase